MEQPPSSEGDLETSSMDDWEEVKTDTSHPGVDCFLQSVPALESSKELDEDEHRSWKLVTPQGKGASSWSDDSTQDGAPVNATHGHDMHKLQPVRLSAHSKDSMVPPLPITRKVSAQTSPMCAQHSKSGSDTASSCGSLGSFGEAHALASAKAARCTTTSPRRSIHVTDEPTPPRRTNNPPPSRAAAPCASVQPASKGSRVRTVRSMLCRLLVIALCTLSALCIMLAVFAGHKEVAKAMEARGRYEAHMKVVSEAATRARAVELLQVQPAEVAAAVQRFSGVAFSAVERLQVALDHPSNPMLLGAVGELQQHLWRLTSEHGSRLQLALERFGSAQHTANDTLQGISALADANRRMAALSHPFDWLNASRSGLQAPPAERADPLERFAALRPVDELLLSRGPQLAEAVEVLAGTLRQVEAAWGDLEFASARVRERYVDVATWLLSERAVRAVPGLSLLPQPLQQPVLHAIAGAQATSAELLARLSLTGQAALVPAASAVNASRGIARDVGASVNAWSRSLLGSTLSGARDASQLLFTREGLRSVGKHAASAARTSSTFLQSGLRTMPERTLEWVRQWQETLTSLRTPQAKTSTTFQSTLQSLRCKFSPSKRLSAACQNQHAPATKDAPAAAPASYICKQGVCKSRALSVHVIQALPEHPSQQQVQQAQARGGMEADEATHDGRELSLGVQQRLEALLFAVPAALSDALASVHASLQPLLDAAVVLGDMTGGPELLRLRRECCAGPGQPPESSQDRCVSSEMLRASTFEACGNGSSRTMQDGGISGGAGEGSERMSRACAIVKSLPWASCHSRVDRALSHDLVELTRTLAAVPEQAGDLRWALMCQQRMDAGCGGRSLEEAQDGTDRASLAQVQHEDDSKRRKFARRRKSLAF